MKRPLYLGARCALCACLCAVCAQLSLPFFALPMTAQTFAVALCAALLGMRGALLTVALYLGMGALGLPVFSYLSGGVGVLLGAGGGFLFGFFALALGCAPLAPVQVNRPPCNTVTPNSDALRRLARVRRAVGASLGLLACHLCGVMIYAAVTGLSLGAAFLSASLPFLLKDALSVVAAYFFAYALRRRVPNL